MRFGKKFKKFTKNSLIQFPLRILKFKRPKWNSLKDILLKSKKNFQILNSLVTIRSFKKMEFLKLYYKEALLNKISFDLLFQKYFSLHFLKKKFLTFKKVKNKLTLFIKLTVLIKPFFYIEILLYYLGFIRSPYEGRHLLMSKQILVNNKSLWLGPYVLKKGDVIEIKKNCLIFPMVNFLSFFSFIEVDYYQKKIVILKDMYALDFADIIFLESLKINNSKFVDYIRLK